MAPPAASPGTSVRCPSGVRRTATERGSAVPPSSPSACRQKESKTGKQATFFLDSAFSADAYFRNFVPSSAQLNTLFKTRTSGQAPIFIPLTQKRAANPFAPSFQPIFTFVRTRPYHRSRSSAPSYGRVRTKKGLDFVRFLYLFSFSDGRRRTFSICHSDVALHLLASSGPQNRASAERKERKNAERATACISRIVREGPRRSPTRIWAQGRPFSRDSFDILTI